MAWFRNHYVCLACDGHWIAEGVEVAEEADCPHCRAYDVTAYRSDDLSAAVAKGSVEKELIATLKATAEKMRTMMDEKAVPKARPIRAKGRGAARVAVH